MIIKTASVENFGSYQNLTFSFENRQLTLITGATGSGKSTLNDIVSWILFGITSKNGSVDEVKNWKNQSKPTKGVLNLIVNNQNITITRIRGSSKENDLYWSLTGSTEVNRGSDLNDTQRLILNIIGTTSELYCMTSYYNEYSPTANFFTAKAKDRRFLLEQIADLSLNSELLEKLIKKRKSIKQQLDQTKLSLIKTEATLTQTTKLYNNSKHLYKNQKKLEEDRKQRIQKLYDDFENQKIKDINDLKKEYDDFLLQLQTNREIYTKKYNKILTLLKDKKDTCPTCGNQDKHTLLLLKELDSAERYINDYSVDNFYYDEKRLKLERQKNPHIYTPQEIPEKSNIMFLKCELLELNSQFENYQKQVNYYQDQIYDLDTLENLLTTLKLILLENSIINLNTYVNDYLIRFFDSEFTVEFVNKNDNLDVILTKNGYLCSFSQLSKGQKQLLKLVFSMSIIKIAQNHSKSTYNTLFLDEPTDGCDYDLKCKAVRLFEEIALSYSSVFIIEHNDDIKPLFNNQIHVKLVNDESVIYEQP